MVSDIEKNKEKIDRKLDSPPTTYGASFTKQNDIKSTRVEVISTADDKINVTEPSSPTHPQYPYNQAHQSISGHLREMDDTPGAERIMEMHKSGTFYEIHPDGTKVTRIYGEDFYIALHGHTLVVGGNLNITVQGDANILTRGNVKQKIGGDYELTVHGDMTTRVRGERLDYTKGQHDIQSFSNITMRSEGTTDIHSKGELDIQTQGNMILNTKGTWTQYAEGATKMKSGGKLEIAADGQIGIRASEKVYIDGSQVRFNDPGPGITIDQPDTNDPEDQDPTGGLTIEDSVVEPSIETILVVKTDNTNIMSVVSSDLTYPKDRTPID